MDPKKTRLPRRPNIARRREQNENQHSKISKETPKLSKAKVGPLIKCKKFGIDGL